MHSRLQGVPEEEEEVQLSKAEKCYAKATALDPRFIETSPVTLPGTFACLRFKKTTFPRSVPQR